MKSKITIPIVFSALFLSVLAFGIDRSTEGHVESPHADALEVVFSTQMKQIAAADKEKWWHDTKERQWLVKRPFAPGVFDTTNTFIVTYKIDGTEVASWDVDTRKKTATLRKADNRRKGK